MIEGTRGTKTPDTIANSLGPAQSATKGNSSTKFQDLLTHAADTSAFTGPNKPGSKRISPDLKACHIGRQHTSPAAAAARSLPHSAVTSGTDKKQSLVAIAMDQPVDDGTNTSASSNATDPADPIASLLAAMNGIGIDTNQLTITPKEYNAFYPNGGYIDREIQVSTKDGRSVQLGLDLLQKNYTIGAWDVQHMLNAPPLQG